MRLRVKGVVLALLSVVAVGVVTSSGVANSVQRTALAPHARIDVGLDAALTGPSAASAGIPYARGAVLAVNQINAAGGIDGHKINLHVEDHKGDPTTGALLMQKFASEHIPVVISNFTAILKAQAPIAQQDHILLLNAAGSESTVALAGTTVYTARPYSAREYIEMARYLASQGHHNIALIAVDNAAGRSGVASMTTLLKHKNVNIADTEYYPVATNDFSSYIAKIRASNPDGIWLFNSDVDGATLVQQARAQGLTQPLFGYGGFSPSNIISAAGSAANGMVITTPVLFDPTHSPAQQTFIDQYQKAFTGAPYNIYSMLHYDAMKSVLVPIIEDAIKKGYGVTGDGLIKALRKHGIFKGGITGDTLFTHGRDALKPMALYRISNGQLVLIKSISVQDELNGG